ncbi:MAG: GAF domain-containing protein [Anaerolineae bacterium]|nr:GAF domain-containing protein [Anaerolineae bacterium]
MKVIVERLRWLWATPVFVDDEEKTRLAAILNPLLVGLMGLLALAAIANVFVFAQKLQSGVVIVFLFILIFLSRWGMHKGYLRFAGALFTWGTWSLCLAVVILSNLRSLLSVSLVAIIVIAGLVLGRRTAIWMGVLTSLAVLGLAVAVLLGYSLPDMFPSPVPASWVVMSVGLVMTLLPLNVALRGLGETLTRAKIYATELEGQREQLEVLVRERTRDLMLRTSYLGATAIVAQEAAMVVGDLDRLLSRVVQIVSEQFDFYHTGIFLLDSSGEWAELCAASSAGGQRMLRRGHRLRVGAEGIVGYVAAHGESRVALDVGEDAVFFNNPDLPATRSEIALPLQLRREMIGVLDVQSIEPEAFSSEDMRVLQSLADQVAVAINNARLLRQVQQVAEGERRARGELVQQAWSRFLRTESHVEYMSNRRGVFAAQSEWKPEMEVALHSARPVVSKKDPTYLAIPLQVSGRIIGVLDGRKPDGWTAEEIAMVTTLTEELGDAVDRARLYRETQRRAAREQMAGQVTANIRESLDLDTVLQTAAREVARALNLPKVEVWLGVNPQTAPSSQSGGDTDGDNSKA